MSTTISAAPSEAVIKWRNETGALLNDHWHKSGEVRKSEDNQLMMVFGRLDSDKPLHTPLALSAHHSPEEPADDLMIIAAEMWRQPTSSRVLGVYDPEWPYTGFRVVIATSRPISQELSDQLYQLLHDHITRNLPDEIFYPQPI